MKYVAAAAEIGNKASKVKTLVEHCGFCNAVLARQQVCALCKEVAHCGAHHQKTYQVHKKQCKVRKKQSTFEQL